MVIKTTFTFEQLNDNAKEYARQKYRESRDYSWECDFVSEDMVHILSENGFELDKNGLSWDLSYSQGDYVGINGKIKEDKLNELMMERLDKRDKKKYKFWLIDTSDIEITQNISHHHYYGQQVDVSVEINDEDDYGLIINFSNKIECAEEVVEDYVEELIGMLKKQGYEQLSYYNSDEYIDGFFINNDYEFDEDGEIL